MNKGKEYSCKLLSFDVKDEGRYDDRKFVIYAFGIDEKRQVYTVRISDFKPFIYIKVQGKNIKWDKAALNSFKEALIEDLAERDVIIGIKHYMVLIVIKNMILLKLNLVIPECTMLLKIYGTQKANIDKEN